LIGKTRAYLCYLKTNPHDHKLFKIQLNELENLAKAASFDVVGKIVQVNKKPDSRYLFGSGKVEELAKKAKEENVDVVIFYNRLSVKQQFNLRKKIGKEVIDRYDLTLKIFDMEANDETSKLQINLARLIKEIPYQKLLASINYKIGREHPGLKSLGEYSYHKVVSSLLKSKAKIERELEYRIKMHEINIAKKKKEGIPIVCISGYYNAGKTSLFNAITNLNKPVSDTPFTTLSSKYYLVNKNDIKFYIVDTIGFVIDLDPSMFYSFRLSLKDITSSNLVLLMMDISDEIEIFKLRTSASLNYLSKLNVSDDRILLVFNKIDKVKEEEINQKVREALKIAGNKEYILISTRDKESINALLEKIRKNLINLNKKEKIEVQIT